MKGGGEVDEAEEVPRPFLAACGENVASEGNSELPSLALRKSWKFEWRRKLPEVFLDSKDTQELLARPLRTIQEALALSVDELDELTTAVSTVLPEWAM